MQYFTVKEKKMRTLKISIFAILLFACVGTLQAQDYIVTNIAYAKRDLNADYLPDDTFNEYEVRGRITSQNFTTNATDIYIQDTSDNVGIWVRGSFDLNETIFTLGKEVIAAGTISQTNGVRLIFSPYESWFEDAGSGVSVVPPLNVSIATLLASPESYECTLVQITNATIAGDIPSFGSSATLSINDGSSLDLRINSVTDIDGQLTPTNESTYIGLFLQHDTTAPFDSGYQLLPRSYADIIQTTEEQSPEIFVVNSNAVFSVIPGDTLSVNLIGLDRNSEDVLILSKSTGPGSVTDNGDRTGSYSWSTDIGDAGTVTSVVVQVSDGVATSSVELALYVLTEEYANIILNELLWDPSDIGLDGDANGDGVYDFADDEFVEIVNNNTGEVDISNWEFIFGSTVYFTFPAGTIMTGNTAVVVFGGTNAVGTFGGAQIFNAGWSGLNNSPGDNNVILKDDTGSQIFSWNYRSFGKPNTSATRNPDITGDYVLHNTIVPPGLLQSPGTMVSGQAFAGSGMTNTAPVITPIGDQSVVVGQKITVSITTYDVEANAVTISASGQPATAVVIDNSDGTGSIIYTGQVSDIGSSFPITVSVTDGMETNTEAFNLSVLDASLVGLIINEVMVDPTGTPNFDSNNDGVVDDPGNQDEFVEIYNGTTQSLDMAGFMINDAAGLKHTFTSYILPTGGAIVVFGGGSIASFAYPPAQLASSGSLGLNNTADSVILYSPQSNEVSRYEYTNTFDSVSWTRSPDITGSWANHLIASGSALRASPGRKLNGSAFIANQPPMLAAVGNKLGYTSNLLSFNIDVAETDGDTVTIVMSNKPSTASFVDNGNKTATFTWTPLVTETGVYTVTVNASDKDGFDEETFTITINSSEGGMPLDISGYKILQYDSAQSYTFLAGTEIQPNSYIVIGRNADKASFEAFWGVTLDANVVYINTASASVPQMNGAETYELQDDTLATIDGPTAVAMSGANTYQRTNANEDATLTASWTVSASANATPGSGCTGDGTAGVVISEYSEASTFDYEFVEIFYDAGGTIDPNEPDLTITNPATSSLTVSSATYTVQGTANTSVVGQISWTNALTGGASSISAATAWSITDIALNVGDNVITVSGTNSEGKVASDSVTVTLAFLPPVIQAASGVASTQFNANWLAAVGATGYRLDVDTNGTFSSGNLGGLFISEVTDPSDVANAKYVELYNASGSEIDFSTATWYISRQANGGSWAHTQLSGTVADGGTFVVGYKQATYESSYSDVADQYSGNISGNGDDGYFLCQDGGYGVGGTLVDAYGVVDQDGSGFDWEYLDSRAVRNSDILEGNTTWTSSEWTIPGSAAVADMTPHDHTVSGGGGGDSSYVPGYQNLDVGNVTTYAVTGLTEGVTYHYRVRAYNDTVTTINSGVTNVTTGASTTPEITGFSVPAGATASATLTTTINGETYALEYTTDPTASPVVWTEADSDVGDGGELILTDALPSDVMRIYRVVLQ